MAPDAAEPSRVEAARAALAQPGIASWSVRLSLLGDENRLRLLLALHRAPGMTVSELAPLVGMSDNAASQALSTLRMAGIVTAARDGRSRRWDIADQQVHSILHQIGDGHQRRPDVP